MSTSNVLAMPYVRPKGGALRRREILWLREGKQCRWCKCPTRLSNDHAWDTATDDHIIPRYRGGTNDMSNIVSACNRCNNRRNHEDVKQLPEGALLGQYKVNSVLRPPPPQVKHNPSRVALTKDEKKAIMSRVPPMEEQRNQALKEIKHLREEVGALQSNTHLHRIEMNVKDAEIQMLQDRLEHMTVMELVRSRVAKWLLRGHEGSTVPPPA